MNRRRLLQSGISEDFVDLGLPSGTLWAKGNIVKNGNTYSIGEETDYGAYFSWGNIDGHNDGEGYDFDYDVYDSTAGKSVKATIVSNDATHDAALARLGSPWRLPTKEHFQELLDNTDTEWTTINGVTGRKLMKKSDHSIYIFFPATGRYQGTENGSYYRRMVFCWSSSYWGPNAAYYYYASNTKTSVNDDGRLLGMPIRAIIHDEFVDLGLPSGLLWCNHNVGGLSPEDYGYYFSLGDIDGYKKGSGYDFSESNYNNGEAGYGYELTGNIPVNCSYDIAQKVMGWRLPTKAEFKELCDNTDSEWVSNYNGTGVNGAKFMKKSDHSVFIFLPACGDYEGNYLEYEGRNGNYRSSTYYDEGYSYLLSFSYYEFPSYVDPEYPYYRYLGMSGRAVISK